MFNFKKRGEVFKTDAGRKWVSYCLINILIFTVIFGGLMIGYGFTTVKVNKNASIDLLRRYASEFNELNLSDIKNIIEKNDSDKIVINPSIKLALYEKRPDGTTSMLSDDVFLIRNQPVLNNKFGIGKTEDIGEFSFYTLETAIGNDSDICLKFFMSNFSGNQVVNSIVLISVCFFIVLIVFTIIASIGMGYLGIKPLVSTYEKQKTFINDMSHEIRTPLTIIKGNLENIMAMRDMNIDEVKELLIETVNEVEYMSDMASGLLNIVRVGRKTVSKKDTSLSELVTNIVDSYSDLAIINSRALVANIDTMDMVIEKDKIKQLLTILLDNALKYTNEGDKIRVRLKKTKTGCILSVSDSGIGVAEEDLTKIFDRFYRADNAKNMQGTGLGLAIAKTIVESYNGTITAKMNYPSGLIIICELNEK